jgi:putative intracellular protease/amidase
MVSWEQARREAFLRDKGVCQVCGAPVFLLGNGRSLEDELRWVDKKYWDTEKAFYVGVRKAEIHHVVPREVLAQTAYEVSQEAGSELREHWYWKLRAMLELDVGNLVTVCVAPCHDEIHSGDGKRRSIVNKRRGSDTLDLYASRVREAAVK